MLGKNLLVLNITTKKGLLITGKRLSDQCIVLLLLSFFGLVLIMLGQDHIMLHLTISSVYMWEAIGTYELPSKKASFHFLNLYEHPWQLLEARFKGDVSICSQRKIMLKHLMMLMNSIWLHASTWLIVLVFWKLNLLIDWILLGRKELLVHLKLASHFPTLWFVLIEPTSGCITIKGNWHTMKSVFFLNFQF